MPGPLPKQDLPLMVSPPFLPKIDHTASGHAQFLKEAEAGLRRELRCCDLPIPTVPRATPSTANRKRGGQTAAAPHPPSPVQVQRLVAPSPANLNPTPTPIGQFPRTRLNALATRLRQFAQAFDTLQRNPPMNTDTAFSKTMAGAEQILEGIEQQLECADAFREELRQEALKTSLMNGVAAIYARVKDGDLDRDGSRRELGALIADLRLADPEYVLEELDVEPEFIDAILTEGADCKSIKKSGAVETAAHTCGRALHVLGISTPHGVRKMIAAKNCGLHAFAAASVFGSPPISSQSRSELRDTVTF